MHPICSWMVTIDLHDELTITPLEAGRLSRYAILWHDEARQRSDIDWSISDDLAVRAHLAVEAYVGRPLPIQMKLDKRIPVGAGLGGGSADAAAMLRGLNDLMDLGLKPAELAGIGASLGSDIPFLIDGGSATVSGLGEQIHPHGICPELHLVLVFPAYGCPTGAVYQAFDQLGPTVVESDRVEALRGYAHSGTLAAALFNDLTAAAASIADALLDDRTRIGDLAERPVALSGSGSTMFVLCDDALHASALAEAIETQLQLPAVAVRTVT